MNAETGREVNAVETTGYAVKHGLIPKSEGPRIEQLMRRIKDNPTDLAASSELASFMRETEPLVQQHRAEQAEKRRLERSKHQSARRKAEQTA